MECSHCTVNINAWYQRKDGEKNLCLCARCKDTFDEKVRLGGCFICGDVTQVMYSETLYEGKYVRLCWLCRNNLTRIEGGLYPNIIKKKR